MNFTAIKDRAVGFWNSAADWVAAHPNATLALGVVVVVALLALAIRV